MTQRPYFGSVEAESTVIAVVASLIGLFLTLGLGWGSAEAAVSPSTLDVAPSPAEYGEEVTATFSVDKTGSGCDNNWGYAKVFVDGVEVGVVTVDSFTGTGNVIDSLAFTPSSSGDKVVKVEFYSGEEDFNNGGASPDCTDTLIGELEVPLTVKAAPEPAKKGTSTITGGGGFVYCDLHGNTPVGPQHMCKDRATDRIMQTLAWRATQNGGDTTPLQIELLKQVVSILQRMMTLVQ